jgi:hypothetical protein
MSTNRQLHLYATLITFLGALTLGTAVPARAQLGLGLVPMRVELHLTPGQEYSGSLKLSNESGERTRIRAEILDFNIDDKATPQFERNLPQEAAYSCKEWLSLNPMEIEIEKGGFLNVRYTLRLPANVAEGSYNCAAGFTTLSAAEQANAGVGMRMAVRIVSAIYVIVGAPTIHGTLKEIKLEPLPPGKDFPQGGWQAVVVLQNQGRMYFRPVGKLEVLDDKGQVVETEEFTSLPVLRERDQRFLFPLKTHLETGPYKLRVHVDVGTGEILEGVAEVSVGPPAPAAPVSPEPGGQSPKL